MTSHLKLFRSCASGCIQLNCFQAFCQFILRHRSYIYRSIAKWLCSLPLFSTLKKDMVVVYTFMPRNESVLKSKTKNDLQQFTHEYVIWNRANFMNVFKHLKIYSWEVKNQTETQEPYEIILLQSSIIWACQSHFPLIHEDHVQVARAVRATWT